MLKACKTAQKERFERLTIQPDHQARAPTLGVAKTMHLEDVLDSQVYPPGSLMVHSL